MASLLIATASATLNRISCCLHFVGSLRVFRSCPHMFFFWSLPHPFMRCCSLQVGCKPCFCLVPVSRSCSASHETETWCVVVVLWYRQGHMVCCQWVVVHGRLVVVFYSSTTTSALSYAEMFQYPNTDFCCSIYYVAVHFFTSKRGKNSSSSFFPLVAVVASDLIGSIYPGHILFGVLMRVADAVILIHAAWWMMRGTSRLSDRGRRDVVICFIFSLFFSDVDVHLLMLNNTVWFRMFWWPFQRIDGCRPGS